MQVHDGAVPQQSAMWQNDSQEFVDLKKLSGKYELKVFNKPFNDEIEALEELKDFEALLIMRERTKISEN